MSHDVDLPATLRRLEDRLARLEAKVDALASPVVPTRLSDPAVASGIDRLLDRLDAIERSVDMLGHFSAKAPVLADAAGATARFAWEQLEARGIDPIAQGQDTLELLLRLGDPAVIGLAERLLDNLGPAQIALDALERVSEDDLDLIATRGAQLTGKLAALLRAPELDGLLDQGPKTMGVVASATTALVESRAQSTAPVGPIGALMALRDPDVGRAVGFGLAVAKRFGKQLG